MYSPSMFRLDRLDSTLKSLNSDAETGSLKSGQLMAVTYLVRCDRHDDRLECDGAEGIHWREGPLQTRGNGNCGTFEKIAWAEPNGSKHVPDLASGKAVHQQPIIIRTNRQAGPPVLMRWAEG